MKKTIGNLATAVCLLVALYILNGHFRKGDSPVPVQDSHSGASEKPGSLSLVTLADKLYIPQQLGDVPESASATTAQ
jgi:hypothetical protein